MQVRLLTPHLCCSSTRVLMAVYIPEAIAVSVCKATFQISEEVIGHWLIKLYVLFWWWARDGFVGVFNTQAQPWEDQWQLCWPQVRKFSWAIFSASWDSPNLHIQKKKKTHTRTQCILPLYCWLTFHSGEAYNTSVDSPVELAVYGLCQSGIKKCQAECKGCCGCSEAQHPQPSLVAHTFISNTAGVLMRTVA